VISTFPAAGGLWITVADLVRFAVAWPSLLPGALAREALRRRRSHVTAPGGTWASGGFSSGTPGTAPGASAPLLVQMGRNQAHVALTNRRIPIEPVVARVIRATAWHPLFHDLRHAGNLFIADAGANLRELMERMGHSSSRAALIYLHSTSDRQRTLADAVADRARTELDASSCDTSVA
jgi:integrase